MKKNILSIAAFLFGMLTAFADNISVPDVTVAAGETATVGISLNNTETNIVSFQMDLTLPEGVTVNKAGCSLSSRITDEEQELTIGKQGDNVYRLTSTSFALTPISGTSGEIITLSLTAAADSEGGTATISNIRLATSSSVKLTLDDVVFNVNICATGITVSPTSLNLYKIEDTATLTATVAPANATDKSVTWTSSDTSVATVDENGTVTAVAYGIATITATTNDGTDLTASCEVTVSPYDFESNNIFYRIVDADTKTVEVTCVEEGEGNADFYFGNISIPKRISKNGTTYTVIGIGEHAFHYCNNLTSITIGDNVTSIGGWAFMGCTSLTTVSLPSGLLHIAYSAFDDCYALANITIPSTATDIEGAAFSDCHSLTSITLPEGLTSIGDWFFDNCTGLTEITIPSTVTEIGHGAFSGCTNLGNITFPEGLTSIGEEAFLHCDAFTSIVIPGNVTSIGESAFAECNNLTTVMVDIDSPLAIDENTFSNRANATLIVPFACKPVYEAADYWTEFQVIVEAEPLQTLTRSLEVLANNEYTPFSVEALDMTAIQELLGTESPVVYCIGADGEKTKEYNLTPNPGFWCDADGKVCSPYDDVCRIGYAFVTDHLEVYQKPGWVQDLGGDYVLYMYLVNEENGNYVTVETSVHVNPVSIANPNVVLTSTSSTNVMLENVDSDDYPAHQLETLDMAAIKEAVGTDEPVVYAADGSGNITKRYTLTPYPGFWFNSECNVCSFGDDDVIGYSFVDDHLEIYQHPGRTNVGDSYTLDIYFVNEANGNCAKHSTTITIVPKKADIAGTVLPWGTQQAWEMKYVFFENTDSEPDADGEGHAWYEEGFNDESWQTLSGPIANISDWFSSVNTLWNTDNASSCYYLRRTFTLDQVDEQGYTFLSQHDDDLKVWLNGELVVDVVWDGTLHCHHIPASKFHEGDNTLAISINDFGGEAFLDYSLGHLFFLKNVETDKYLNKGNAYGTHGVLADEPLPVQIGKQPNGSYTIFFPLKSWNQHLLFRNDAESVYVDYQGQDYGCPYWTITETGDGNYYIQTLTTHETYGQEAMPGTYLGNNPNKEANNEGGDGLGVYNDVDGNAEVGMNITWALVPEGLHTAAQAERLQQLITQANALNIDTNNAQIILDNENSTYTEMLAQILLVDGRINDGMWFDTEKVKELCVANWDTNEDGELSRLEAGAVTSLGDVFKGNTEITSFNELQYFTGLTEIGDYAFEGCTALTSVKFPNSLQRIGEWAFAYCSQLENIDFNGCSAELDNAAFLGCEAIEHLDIPDNIHIVGYSVFNSCKGLKTVVVNHPDEVWPDAIFAECSSLETAELYSKNIASTWTFWNCTNLRSVTFHDNNQSGKYFDQNFYNVPSDLVFNIPEGTAEGYLRKGFVNLSDKSALPLVREEFEAEAARITTMANELADGDKTALTNAISDARTNVNDADDYPTVFAQIAVIKNAAKTFLTTATLPADFDVTAATVTNPDADRFAFGWDFTVHTYGYVGFEDAEDYSSNDISLNKYFITWNGGDGKILQTIRMLPAGVYRLEADVCTWSETGESKGVSLFANNMAVRATTENGNPGHFIVKFENPTTKDVPIGINIVNNNYTWMGADNFRLYYEGPAAAAPNGTELVSSEDATYYIYNVDTGMYLNGGNGWGTQAVLAETGLPVRMTQDGDGYWQVYFREGSRRQQSLYKDGNGNILIDFDGDGDARWIISDSDGSYTIQSVDDLNTDFVLGNDPTRQDIDWEQYITLDSHTDVIRTDNAANNTRWQFIAKADYDLLMAKRYLLATIFRMEQSDIDNEELINSAQAVYDNEDATFDEVVAVTTLLNSQMGMPQEGQPVDMTALIVNPRFEYDTTEGWTGAKLTAGGNAQNTQHQTHEFYQTSFNMFQTITGVPNGRYLLKWKGFHRPGIWEQNASAVVYANSEQKTMKHIFTGISDTRLDESDSEYEGKFIPYQQWGARKYFDEGIYADQLEVEVTDNVLTIGVKNTQEMAEGHWVIFSDFELYIMENEEQLYHKLTADNVKCVAGCMTTFNVNLLNRDEVTAFQFEVELPEGVTIYEENGQRETQLTTRGNGHDFGCIKTSGNTYQFSALSLQSKSFKKNEGPVVRMTLTTDGTMELGDYPIKVKNTELSKPNGMQVLPFDFTSTLTIKAADPGDVNGDGKITVTDAVYVFKYINGVTPEHFQRGAADVNNSNSITINDAVLIVNMVLGKDQAMGSRAAKRLLKQLAGEY